MAVVAKEKSICRLMMVCLSLFVTYAFLMGSTKVCGIFFEQMNGEAGLNGAMTGLIFISPQGIAEMSGPLQSMLLGRFSYRQVAIPGGIIFGLSFICSGLFATRWYHFLTFAVMGGLGLGGLTIAPIMCVKGHAQESFNTLLPLLQMGSFTGIIVLPAICELFLTRYGLGAALCLFGALAWNTIPCGAVLLGDNTTNSIMSQEVCNEVITDYTDLKPAEEKVRSHEKQALVSSENGQETSNTGRGKTLRKIIESYSYFKNPSVSLFTISVMCRSFPKDAWMLFLIPYVVEIGMTRYNAVSIAAICGVGGIFGRIGAAGSFRMERVSSYYIYAGTFIGCAVAFGLFDLSRTFPYISTCAFICGFFFSMQQAMTLGILNSLVEENNYRSAYGTLNFGCGAVALMTGYIAGAIFDVTGSFKMVFHINVAMSLVGWIMIMIGGIWKKA